MTEQFDGIKTGSSHRANLVRPGRFTFIRMLALHHWHCGHEATELTQFLPIAKLHGNSFGRIVYACVRYNNLT